jgi:hypothetical protein
MHYCHSVCECYVAVVLTFRRSFGHNGNVCRLGPYWGSQLQAIKTNKLHGLSQRANYTDRATAACRRSDCQLLRIKGATWSA